MEWTSHSSNEYRLLGLKMFEYVASLAVSKHNKSIRQCREAQSKRSTAVCTSNATHYNITSNLKQSSDLLQASLAGHKNYVSQFLALQIGK